jgi:hypothetical protein
MSEVHNWDIAKQYLAAHYYLSEERPISISEAQRAQLGALHLHVSHGPYNEKIQVADLDSCTTAERKKRVAEWQKLGQISAETAMRKFIDLINNLFPNWTRFRKLFYEFEIEWINMPDQQIKKKNQGIGKDLKKEKFLQRNQRINEISPGNKGMLKNESRGMTPDVFQKIQKMRKSRNFRTKSRNESNDSRSLIMNVKKFKKVEESCRFPRVNISIQQYQEQDSEFLKGFVEDLQSYRGGNLRRTSATKMPKGFERVDFDMVEYSEKKKNFQKELNQFGKEIIEREIVKMNNKNKVEEMTATSTVMHVQTKLGRIQQVLQRIEMEYDELDKLY